jgi:Cupin-like domain
VAELAENESEDSRSLTREWRRWAAISLMNGTQLVDVLSTLRAEGFLEDEAVRFCANLYDENAAFEAGQWIAQQLHKIQSVLNMRAQMRDLSEIPVDVERRSGLSEREFLDEYYAQNKPVVLTDVCDRWPARSLWNPSYLADTLGGAEVEVMTNRNADPNYEINADDHKFRMPFNEYVAKMGATKQDNDVYLVANNKLLEMPEALPLWDDFELDERYLRPDPNHSQAFLWLGPAGTITPLHHDTVNLLFNQVAGLKQFILIPSLEIHQLYNHLAVYSEVDPLAPDLERYPKFRDAHQIHLDIRPGESLFVPAGWWHHVVAREASISISFTNFAYPNYIEWEHPSLPL